MIAFNSVGLVAALGVLLGMGLAGCSGGGSGGSSSGGSSGSSSAAGKVYYSNATAPEAYPTVEVDRDTFTLTIAGADGAAPGPITGGKNTDTPVLVAGVGVLGTNGEIIHDSDKPADNCSSGHCLRDVVLYESQDATAGVHALVDIVPADHPADDHLDYFAFGYWTDASGGTPSFGGIFYGGSPVFSVSAGGSVGRSKASYTGKALGHYADATVPNGSFIGDVALTASFAPDTTFSIEGDLINIDVMGRTGIVIPDAALNADGTVTAPGLAGTWDATFYGKSSKISDDVNYYAPPPAVAGGIFMSGGGMQLNGAYGAYLNDDHAP